jgi:nucleoside-diphosphate-sugar epimerase
MLTHKEKTSPGEKVLVIGCNGFIGKALSQALCASDFIVDAISSKDINLVDSKSTSLLAEKIKNCDHLVMLSCLTPDKGKGTDVFMKNILMAKHVCDAILQQEKRPHIVYFSSDAVYNFDESLVHEETPPCPIDMYGVMHRARELMFLETIAPHLAIIRPTLVYGPGDSHNSYGPNRFRREAFKEGSITIFGEGEDTRAHIFIDDLVKLTMLILKNNSIGILNGSPDESVRFGELATNVAQFFDKPIKIIKKPRAAEPNHRYFEASLCYSAFPGFTFTSLSEGLSITYQKMLEDPNA